MLTDNERTVVLRIQRRELCDLILAVTAVVRTAKEEGRSAAKWSALRLKLKMALDAHDAKRGT